jgi:hypothetical protein
MAAAKKPIDTTEDANGVPAFLKIPANEREESWKKSINQPLTTTKAIDQVKGNKASKTALTDARVEDGASTPHTADTENKMKYTMKRGKIVAKEQKQEIKRGKATSKTAMVGQLLLRKEGCTTADILKATGWPSVSVPAQAKAVGLGLRKEKDGKVTRYFGVPKK